MRESTLSWIGHFEEKIDLAHIYLAVLLTLAQTSTPVIVRMAIITAKSDMKPRTPLVKKLWALNFFRCQAIRKVPMNRRQLIRKALGW